MLHPPRVESVGRLAFREKALDIHGHLGLINSSILQHCPLKPGVAVRGSAHSPESEVVHDKSRCSIGVYGAVAWISFSFVPFVMSPSRPLTSAAGFAGGGSLLGGGGGGGGMDPGLPTSIHARSLEECSVGTRARSPRRRAHTARPERKLSRRVREEA